MKPSRLCAPQLAQMSRRSVCSMLGGVHGGTARTELEEHQGLPMGRDRQPFDQRGYSGVMALSDRHLREVYGIRAHTGGQVYVTTPEFWRYTSGWAPIG